MRLTSTLATLATLAVTCLVCAGCANRMDPSELTVADSHAALAMRERYDRDAPLAESLFKEDQAVLSNEDLHKILSAKVVLPDRSKLAVVRFGRLPYWWGWSEDFVRVNEQIDDTFLGTLRTSGKLRDVAYLPSLVTPHSMTLPYLRQAAARCQADLLLVYRTSTRTYTKQRWFAAERTKAYCTVEAVVLDTRTGLIPFSTVVNEYFAAAKKKGEMNFSETVAKAEQKAIGEAWRRLARETVAFLDRGPAEATARAEAQPRKAQAEPAREEQASSETSR